MRGQSCLLLVVLLSLLSLGCKDQAVDKSLPAPIDTPLPYEMEGRIVRLWGGDNFEFGTNEELHYLLLRGVACPQPGQKFHVESRNCSSAMTRGKKVHIRVVARDPMMREIAEVTVLTNESAPGDELDMGLRLIELGMAWYTGDSFENSRAYQAAENVARQKQIGLWSQPNPLPPWDFQPPHQ